MTNDEISKYIHTEIMGECPHEAEYLGTDYIPGKKMQPAAKCKLCGLQRELAYFPSGKIPDYCSDSSPRELLNAVVAKMRVETLGKELRKICGITREGKNANCGLGSSATAEQIARACVQAWKESQE